MPFITKIDFSNNRQVKQRIETIQVLSGATSFGVPFSSLPTGANLDTSGITQSFFVVISTFSGNSGTTVYNWYDPRMSLGETNLSAITPSNSATTQNTNQVYQPTGYTTIDGNVSATGYTGVSFSVQVTGMTNLGGGNYSGYVSTLRFDVLSATSLDFVGRTIWADVSGITRTDRLIIYRNPTINHVWTCIDSEGMGAWMPSSGGTSGGTNVTITGGTYNNSTGTATFTNNTGGTFSVSGFSTGGTSSGSGSIAYGYAAGQSTTSIGADADVIFDLGATPFPNSGFTSVPAPAGTSFVVATTGDYEFDFYVAGTHAAGATTPVQFALWINGAVASVGGNAFEFSSNLQSGATDVQVCRGQGIIKLTAGDVITLHNRTNTTTDAVASVSVGGGVGAGRPNRTLSLKMMSSGGSGGTGTTAYWSASTGTNAIVVDFSNSLASGISSLAEGEQTTALGQASHAEGALTLASGGTAHAEGYQNTAGGNYTHAEGRLTIASGDYTHSEGFQTTAIGIYSHVEGSGTTALLQANACHVEGINSVASGNGSHAEGQFSTAQGEGSSHAEGRSTTANALAAHSEGQYTHANGIASHSGGYGQSTTGKIVAGGRGSLNHSSATPAITGLTNAGANADYSAILGGLDQSINTGSTCSIIIGGSGNTVNNGVLRSVVLGGQNLSATTNDYTYVGSLNVNVVGSSAFANDIRIDANGNLTTNTSDVRLKENVNTISGALDKIKELRGVTYNWKDRSAGGNELRLGFIAQEVAEVEPLLVFTNKHDNYKGLHIDGIIPLIVEAIKELSSGVTTFNNTHLETETILAEDNNIDLNYSGTSTTAIGGGITVLHAMGQDKGAQIITDSDGNWITNNDFKSKALTIPMYTPTSSDDENGSDGNITRDNKYLYLKTSDGWVRSSLERF